MRKWKDEIPSQMKELNKASIIFLGIVNSFTVLWIVISEQVNGMQIFGLVSSAILIYLMLSGNLYKIIKAYVNWSIKRRDNRWR